MMADVWNKRLVICAILIAALALSATITVGGTLASGSAGIAGGAKALAQPGEAEVPQCVYYFYLESCEHCQRVKGYLQSLQGNYSWLDVHYFEISNLTTYQYMVEFYNFRNMTNWDVPVVFIGNEALQEEEHIMSTLPALLANYTGWTCPSSNSSVPTYQSPEPPIMIFFAMAVADSLNPCALSVLIVLAIALSVTSKSIWRSGIAYIAGNFVAYLLIGFVVFSTLSLFSLPSYLPKVIAVLAIIVAIISLFSKLPVRTRPIIKRTIDAITSPYAAFGAGALLSTIELLCTGGPYFLALTLISQSRMTQLEVVPYLIVYNLIFVLPLVAVLFAYSLTKSTNIPKNYIRYISVALMIIIGIALFFI